MSPEAESIVELAETIKELVRLLRLLVPNPSVGLDMRLEAIYKKASRAKDRMDV